MMRKTITQVNVVREHLQKKGSIDINKAIKKYGITRLSAVIYILRQEGLNIITKEKKVLSRWGKTYVAEYILVKK